LDAFYNGILFGWFGLAGVIFQVFKLLHLFYYLKLISAMKQLLIDFLGGLF